MRVISGSAKGRKLFSVPGAGTRPITARVKTALYNILGPQIVDSVVLDLFAGTGSVGIEALSRGAGSVVFVERARKAIVTLRRNLEITRLGDRAEIVFMDAFRYVEQARDTARFDYVYVAPPQYKQLWAKMLLAIDDRGLLSADGVAIVQMHPKEFAKIALRNLRLIDERNYGSSMLKFYAPKEHAREGDD